MDGYGAYFASGDFFFFVVVPFLATQIDGLQDKLVGLVLPSWRLEVYPNISAGVTFCHVSAS